jgi:hypothetical protein
MIPLARHTNKPFSHDINLQMTHRFGGDGFAIIEMMDDEYCRIAKVGEKDVDNRAYLSWHKLLKPWQITLEGGSKKQMLIEGELLERVEELRSDLKSGKRKVKGTHIV